MILTIPTHSHSHPPTQNIPPLTHKKCLPTPTHPWKMSTHSHPPKIYLHQLPSTHNKCPHTPTHPKCTPTHPHPHPLTHKNIHPLISTQKIPSLSPTHLWPTSSHTKYISTYPQLPRIYLHASLPTHKKMSTQSHPNKIYLQTLPPTIKNVLSPPTTQNILYPPPPHTQY